MWSIERVRASPAFSEFGSLGKVVSIRGTWSGFMFKGIAGGLENEKRWGRWNKVDIYWRLVMDTWQLIIFYSLDYACLKI